MKYEILSFLKELARPLYEEKLASKMGLPFPSIELDDMVEKGFLKRTDNSSAIPNRVRKAIKREEKTEDGEVKEVTEIIEVDEPVPDVFNLEITKKGLKELDRIKVEAEANKPKLVENPDILRFRTIQAKVRDGSATKKEIDEAVTLWIKNMLI